MFKKLIFILLITLIFSCENSEEILRIDGRWDIYENRYILSEPIESIVTPDDSLYFSGGQKRIKNNKIYDFGSIKQIIDVEKGEKYSLYISGILSSSKIWVDNKLLGEYGVLGHSVDSSVSDIKRAVLNFSATSDKAEVVIEFSNFDFQSKFLFKWIVYGKSRGIISQYIKNQSKDYITTGLLFMCSSLFLLIFFVNIKNRYNLYFSLFTLSYGLRSFLMKNTTIEEIIPWFNWVMTFQLNKASEIWALTFILLFFIALYPNEFKNPISKIIVCISSIISFLAFIPLDIFNKFNILGLMHLLVLTSGLYIIINLVKCAIHRRYLAKWTLFSIIIFFASIIFDIFADRTILVFDYYSAQVVIVVVVVMFFIIARKRSESSKIVLDKEQMNSNIRRVFSMYVPIEILRTLNNENLEDRLPGDSNIESITMVFIDIRNFTKLSEVLTSEENFSLINKFYEVVGRYVTEFDGYIESYGGDGVKAIFPLDPENAFNAVKYISRDVYASSGLKIGLSIHFGEVVLGTIGGGSRIQVTAISDVTRILGGMDKFNSKMNKEILITQEVYGLCELSDEIVIYLGNITLVNEEEPKKLYEVISDHIKISEEFINSFSSGVLAIEDGDYVLANDYFRLAHHINPNDELTNRYIEELNKFQQSEKSKFSIKLI